VRLWNPKTGKELRKMTGHGDIVTWVAFLPDGRTLASASQDRTVKLWEVATGKERLSFSQHTNWVRSVVLSPDGRTAASAGYDNIIRLWDTVTGKELKQLKGHTSTIWALDFAPDGKHLASGSQDNTARIWKVSDITGRAAPKETKLEAKELEAHWKALESDDGIKSYKAVGALVQAPESALGMLKTNLKPAKEVEGAEKKAEKYLADLEDSDYAVRKKAIDALSTMGATIVPQVRKALTKATDVDVKLRLYVVLRALEGTDATSP